MTLSSSLFDRANEAATYIASHSREQPRVGIILGSGLGQVADSIDSPATLRYGQIPHFPQPSVEGHSGNLTLGALAGVPVAVMQGRVHAYEGRSMDEVTFSTRVLGLLGVRTLVVTNAAGGINPDQKPGSLALIRDHINLTGLNPLTGPNEPRFGLLPGAGVRFVDMSGAYSPALRKLAREEAAMQGYDLREGVYLAVSGPSYETPAEILAFGTLGADMVGMSTVHEVIVARHMGLDVLGISLVTNAAAGVVDAPVDHEEVLHSGARCGPRLGALLRAVLPRIAS